MRIDAEKIKKWTSTELAPKPWFPATVLPRIFILEKCQIFKKL